MHYLDGGNGVNDLDVWTFYAAISGRRFPADKRETHAHFGLSDLGHNRYDVDRANSRGQLATGADGTTTSVAVSTC